MNISLKLFVIPAVVLITGCASAPPDNQGNLCSIFRQYDGWYEDALDMEKKWGTPIPLAMAFVKQESAFVHDAMPARRYKLGFIPWGRMSSAYGYSQALDGAWDDFEKSSDGGSRSDFGDALNFIGWYTSITHRELGVRKNDVYNQYLAYHEGRGGFKRRTYNSKPWLIRIARKVERQGKTYKQQLQSCKRELENNRSWWPF